MAQHTAVAAEVADTAAPHPGSKQMPTWNVGELIDAPRWTWRHWFALLGPGLLMGGSAIGGGEWLMGPTVTAKYGGALLWLATLSILGQVLYNIEISRYTLYSGEPIFTGKFRTLPGPMFWLFVYLVLDFGAVFPYLAANAAIPAAAVLLGEIPDATNPEHQSLMKNLSYGVFLLALVPLVFGGKIYNALKAIMAFKIVVVLGFLLLITLAYSHASTWTEITSGFFKFGTFPVRRGEDLNKNGQLDAHEDWDGDGRLDVNEWATKSTVPTVDTDGDGTADNWPDYTGDQKPDPYDDVDGDGKLDGDGVDNLFVALYEGRAKEMLSMVDLSLIASIAALVAIAGSGGLSNTPVSNYTRDQGWGMGWHVGAIPSVIGGRNVKLSHVGTVFKVTPEAMPRWKRWYKHVLRDQLAVWMPACFLGLALPSMLSVEFLPRGTVANDWTAAGMTADGVAQRVTEENGSTLGNLCWLMTLFCGFLVLAPTMATSADGLIRRWIDVFWTASGSLRKLDPSNIRWVYFTVLLIFAVFGLAMLHLGKPKQLLLYATMIMNFALGFSCWHTLALNLVLLPKALRPNWFIRIGLVLTGAFFLILAVVSTYYQMTNM